MGGERLGLEQRERPRLGIQDRLPTHHPVRGQSAVEGSQADCGTGGRETQSIEPAAQDVSSLRRRTAYSSSAS